MKKIIIMLCVIASSVCSGKAPQVKWRKLPDLPRGCYGQSVARYNGKIIVSGGTYWESGKKHWISESYSLNTAAGCWDKFRSLYAPYAYGAGAVYNGKFVISGGNLPDNKVNKATFVLNLKNPRAEWSKIAMPGEALIYPGTAVKSGRLYAFGGLTRPGDWRSACATLRCLDLASVKNCWRKLPEMPALPRALSAMCEQDGNLYVFGGARMNKNNKIVNLPECWSFNIKTRHWKRLADMPFATRCSLALPWKKWIVVFAGCVTDANNKAVITSRMFVYNTATDTYSKHKDAPYSAVVSGMIHDNKIYLAGGEDKPRSRTASCALGIIGGSR